MAGRLCIYIRVHDYLFLSLLAARPAIAVLLASSCAFFKSKKTAVVLPEEALQRKVVMHSVVPTHPGEAEDTSV